MTVSTIPGMSRAQAAEALGVGPGRIGQLIREGRLPYVQTPLGKLIDEGAVAEMRREREEARRQQTNDE